MPITKRALLISNPGETGAENYCKGVYVDIKNYQRLLFSAQGGAWETNEVTTLDRPSVADVRNCIEMMSAAEYVFVMFTGHGWFSASDHDRVLELRSGQSIASNELLRGTKRRTVVLDCCQKVHQESLMEKAARQIALAANATEARRTPNREACRKLYLDSIQAAPQGAVWLTSCAIDEVSTDDDTRGGRYNGSLIECVDDWAALQAKKQFHASPEMYSIVAAHECAAERTRKLSGGKQNPSIEKPKTGPYFPLGVFA